MVNVLSNLILCFMLFLAVIFFIQLLKKIKSFDATSEKISPLLKTVLGVAETMSKNIENLDKIAQENKDVIHNNIPEVQHLRDDFDILIAISEKLALRLEDSIEKARKAEYELELVLKTIEESKAQKERVLDELKNSTIEVSKQRNIKDYEENSRGSIKKIYAGSRQNQVSSYSDNNQFVVDKVPPSRDLLEVIKQLR